MLWIVQIKGRYWCRECKTYHERWVSYAANSVFTSKAEATEFAGAIYPDHQSSVRVVDMSGNP